MQLLLHGGVLHKAPIPENVERVLDCGTGTGIWYVQLGFY